MRRLIFGLVTISLGVTGASAQTLSDVAYRSDKKQTFDVYQPHDSSNAPIIVMLHGGAWQAGDKTNPGVWENKVDYWGDKGFIFVSVNTRLLPDATPLEQAEDLAIAMATVQTRAAEFGGDAKQITLMGHSAGGHVAALLATRQDMQQEAGVRPWKGTVLLDTAALDVTSLMERTNLKMFESAFGDDHIYWTAASPNTHLDANDGPFLVVCSSSRYISCPAAREFQQAAASSDNTVTILPVPLKHGELNALLGEPSEYTSAVDAWIKALK